MPKTFIYFLTLIILLGGMVGSGIGQSGAPFPTKPITFIVPWPPGGTGDISCRILGTGMEKFLKKPVVVKNVPGAGSMVGAKELVDSKPDGHTIALLGISATIAQYTSVSPIMLDEYVAVSGIIYPPLLLLVHQNAPWKTLGELIDYGKKNPMKLKNGNAGTGVIDHLYSSKFSKTTGVQFTQVPFRGWGPALAELAGGHVDTVFSAMGAAKPLITAGKIRPLGIAAEKRYPAYPEIPTFKENGVDLIFNFWESVVVPKGTPKEIINILDEAVRKAFADLETKQKIKEAGLDLEYMDTEGIARLRKESDREIFAIVKDLGLQVEKK